MISKIFFTEKRIVDRNGHIRAVRRYVGISGWKPQKHPFHLIFDWPPFHIQRHSFGRRPDYTNIAILRRYRRKKGRFIYLAIDRLGFMEVKGQR